MWMKRKDQLRFNNEERRKFQTKGVGEKAMGIAGRENVEGRRHLILARSRPGCMHFGNAAGMRLRNRSSRQQGGGGTIGREAEQLDL